MNNEYRTALADRRNIEQESGIESYFINAENGGKNLLRPAFVVRYSLLLVLCSLFFCVSLDAQRYGNAVGIRGGGGEVGVTFQQRIFYQSTLEGMFNFSVNHWVGTGLYEFHQPMLTRGLNFYLGAGPHFGRLFKDGELAGRYYYGLSGIVGIEWKFPALPIVISADLRPQFHLNHVKTTELRPGISIRYILRTERESTRKSRAKAKAKSRASEPNKLGAKTKHRVGDWWERNFENKKAKKKRAKRKKRKARNSGK